MIIEEKTQKTYHVNHKIFTDYSSSERYVGLIVRLQEND